jgi:hypothetical protein
MSTSTVLTGTAQIGNGWDGVYTGLVDDVAVYNTVLSSQQVSSLYNAMTIPEPSAITLLMGGALSLLAYAWRRQK